MKKKLGLLAMPLALAFTLTGCNYVDAAVDAAEQATGSDEVGTTMTKGKKIETEAGGYTKVRASDVTLNSIKGSKVLGGDGKYYGHDSRTAKSTITEYFYDHFIDSTALEGGAKSLESWKKAAINQTMFLDTEYATEWLKHPESAPVLTAKIIAPKVENLSFINDGKPRLTDANLTFNDKKTYVEEYPEGWIMTVPTTWEVDYRITDETLLQSLRAANPKATDESILERLTDEAKDGKGENVVHVSGTADFTMLAGSEEKIYAFSHQPKSTFGEDIIRPEFQKGGARYDEELPDK